MVRPQNPGESQAGHRPTVDPSRQTLAEVPAPAGLLLSYALHTTLISEFQLSKSSSKKFKSTTYRSDLITLTDGVVAEGDADGVFSVANRGGNDTFLGAANQINIAYGETDGAMSGGARGGDDKFLGGNDALNLFVGDAASLSGKGTRGGNDTFRGGDANDGYGLALNVAVGDATGYGASLSPVEPEPTVLASTEPVLSVETIGSILEFGASLFDPAGGVRDGARGGDDKLYGGDVGVDGYAVLNLLVGDADFIGATESAGTVSVSSNDCDKSDAAQGGNDKLYGGSVLEDGYAINLMAGDALVIGTDGRGGDDKLVGGNGNLDGYGGVGPSDEPAPEPTGPSIAINLLLGDALLMNGVAGDDKVQGGDGAINLLMGDGYAAIGPDATDGDDVLYSGENSLFLMLGDTLDGYGIDSGNVDLGTLAQVASESQLDGEGGEDRFVIESDSIGAIVDFSLADGDKIDLSRLLDHDDDEDGDDDHDDDDCDDESGELSAEMIALLETIIVNDEAAPETFGGLTGTIIDFSLADASYGMGSGVVAVVGVTAEELEANLWQVFIV